ncbi:shikimate kinase [Jejudonia soesokkakensis]|uniref:Shikimate kinase n=1 Tax=Jejudonia soesokkakensis TaxID=1323432 RepID=A0ABW2MVL8_9FLAO
MQIILVGYMGSGKSYVGNLLAEVINYPFIDLDSYIEKREGYSISEIFQKKGELYFRKKETAYLKEILSEKSNLILATGGGTPCYGANNDLINSKGASTIYLKTTIEELVERLFSEKSKRPLIEHLTTKALLEDFIRKHLFERSFYYNQSQRVITTDNKSREQIVEEIVAGLF